jgi:hypothetical protein
MHHLIQIWKSLWRSVQANANLPSSIANPAQPCNEMLVGTWCTGHLVMEKSVVAKNGGFAIVDVPQNRGEISFGAERPAIAEYAGLQMEFFRELKRMRECRMENGISAYEQYLADTFFGEPSDNAI